MICELITDHPVIPPKAILDAYAYGAFPMADTASTNRIYWLAPDPRCIIPLDTVHLPRKLRKTIRNTDLTVTVDTDFRGVITRCAGGTESRPDTWINPPIRAGFIQLHEMGFAHSVEVRRGDVLVGGLYGLAINGAFFGESMFAAERDASKVAFVHLIAILRAAGFRLLDSQMMNQHLAQFGAIEISKNEFKQRLTEALINPVPFGAGDIKASLEALTAPQDPNTQ